MPGAEQDRDGLGTRRLLHASSDVLGRVQDHPASAIDELLPGAWATAA